jgi:hypothetical protein
LDGDGGVGRGWRRGGEGVTSRWKTPESRLELLLVVVVFIAVEFCSVAFGFLLLLLSIVTIGEIR